MTDDRDMNLDLTRCIICGKPFTEKQKRRFVRYLIRNADENGKGEVPSMELAYRTCCSQKCKLLFKYIWIRYGKEIERKQMENLTHD